MRSLRQRLAQAGGEQNREFRAIGGFSDVGAEREGFLTSRNAANWSESRGVQAAVDAYDEQSGQDEKRWQ